MSLFFTMEPVSVRVNIRGIYAMRNIVYQVEKIFQSYKLHNFFFFFFISFFYFSFFFSHKNRSQTCLRIIMARDSIKLRQLPNCKIKIYIFICNYLNMYSNKKLHTTHDVNWYKKKIEKKKNGIKWQTLTGKVRKEGQILMASKLFTFSYFFFSLFLREEETHTQWKY